MTHETEILKFLREQNLPKDEEVWREEDCAYLTIAALEELQVTIEQTVDENTDLDEQLNEVYADFSKLESDNVDLKDELVVLEEEVLRLEEEAKEARKDYEKELSFLRNEKEDLENDILKLEMKLNLEES